MGVLSYGRGRDGIDVTFGPELSEAINNGFVAIPILIELGIEFGPLIITGLKLATLAVLSAALAESNTAQCMARYFGESDRCYSEYPEDISHEVDGERFRCIDRAKQRLNTCLRGMPDPGPQWPDESHD
jgi:hypothetical protein